MNYEEAIQRLAEKIRDLSSSVTEKLLAFEERLRTVETSCFDLKKGIEALQRSIADFKEVTPQTTNSTSEENPKVEKMERQLADYEEALSTLEKKQEEVEESLSGIATTLSSLQTSLEELSIDAEQVEVTAVLLGD